MCALFIYEIVSVAKGYIVCVIVIVAGVAAAVDFAIAVAISAFVCLSAL